MEKKGTLVPRTGQSGRAHTLNMVDEHWPTDYPEDEEPSVTLDRLRCELHRGLDFLERPGWELRLHDHPPALVLSIDHNWREANNYVIRLVFPPRCAQVICELHRVYQQRHILLATPTVPFYRRTEDVRPTVLRLLNLARRYCRKTTRNRKSRRRARLRRHHQKRANQ